MKWLLTVAMLTYVALADAEKLTFHNYTVYSIIPKSLSALKILKDWEETRYNDFNFWSPTTTVNRSVEVMVPPHLKGFVERIVNTMGMSSRIFMENVQEHIDKENVKSDLRGSRSNWESYQTLDEVKKLLLLNLLICKEILLTGCLRSLKICYKFIILLDSSLKKRIFLFTFNSNW